MHLDKEFYLLRLAPVCSRTLIRAPIPRWLVIACKSLTWAALLLNQSVSARSEPDFHSLWPDLWSCISSCFRKLLLGTTAGRWIHLRLHFVAGIFVFISRWCRFILQEMGIMSSLSSSEVEAEFDFICLVWIGGTEKCSESAGRLLSCCDSWHTFFSRLRTWLKYFLSETKYTQ
jgi:hypothetical protein